MTHHFLQVTLEDLSAIIRTSDWETESPFVEVLFSNNSQLFEGNVSKSNWNDFATCFLEDPETYFEQNKLALTCLEAAKKYKYSFRKESDTKIIFIWSKILEGTAVAKCGEIELQLSSNSVFDFVSNCVNTVNTLKKEQETNKKLEKEIEKEVTRLEKEYEAIIQARITCEEQHFAKFQALLNSKKRRIRDLEVKED